MAESKRSRAALTLVTLSAVIAILEEMGILWLPAVQAANEAAHRVSCGNNFQQIGLGLHKFAAIPSAPNPIGRHSYEPELSRLTTHQWKWW